MNKSPVRRPLLMWHVASLSSS